MYNLANNACSKLVSGISASDTQLTVEDGSIFPDPPFLVSIDDEIIKVGVKNGNTFSSLTRGMEGKAAAAHSTGARVSNRFTAGTYDELRGAIADAEEAGMVNHGNEWHTETFETVSGAQSKINAHANSINNPHAVTKLQVGLGNVDNIKQATKTEFDVHINEFLPHGIDNAGFHNSIFRGKDLGTSVTPTQYANIANGTFEDMYIGDYWTINGTKYLIAAFNYYYNTGDTALTQNHITLIPATYLYTHVMNDTNTTEGGYVGSKMYTEGLAQAKSMISSAFGGHVVTHRRYLSNATSNGHASAGVWVDSDIELMNEAMVYGGRVNGGAVYGLYDIGIEKAQLPLFRHRHDLIGIRSSWWLRDVCSASIFAIVHNGGTASRSNASNVLGVRPAFSIS